MCLGRFGQWKLFADHRTQRPVFQTGDERGVNAGQLRRRCFRQDHSAKIDIALHRITRIYLHAAAAPDDRDASALCENRQIFPEIHVRD